ncbi:MAG: hypothetical protein QNL92_08285 [Octadecabacter sp.]
MKAIAEYFRDLAAEDRYFGAEPPTPDAEMLARIAQREISRPVEARSDDSGIVLRAASALAGPTPAIPQTPTQTANHDIADTPASATADETVDATGPQAEAESSDPTSLLVADGPVAQDLAMSEAVATAPQTDTDTDSVAAKLRRIRAVVGSGNNGGETADYSEDLQAPDVADVDPVAAFHADDLDDTDTAGQDAVTQTDTDSDDDTLAAIMARSDADDDEDEDDAPDADSDVQAPYVLSDDDAAEDDAPVAEVAAAAPVTPRVVRMKRADFEAAVQSGDLEETTSDDTDAGEGDSDVSQQPQDHTPAAVVIADLDGADDVQIEGDSDTPLPDDEEAALMEELAEVEREAADSVPTGAARRGREILNDESVEDEAAMSRIMSQTEAELAEPASNRRRQAISQLKAAVAATEAARALGEGTQDNGDAENAFRDDLNQVVRPRRATRGDSQTERPRPAPLKLVASQRVDTPMPSASESPAAPIRPRRVARATTAAPVEAPHDATSFAEFAENMGASELPELLEAAAAYTAFVEGAEEFSRPQIMQKVRALAPDDFNREDGLRSFGTLLREGRINKISNGRFQVSDQTRFHPQRRSAAG